MASPTDGWHETFRAEDRPAGPSDRSFGYTFAGLFAVLCGLAAWRQGAINLWLLGAAAAFLIVTLIAPGLLAPLNRLWSAFGRLVHAVVSPVILAILFYGAITPIGLLARLTGYDPLKRRIDPAAKTYWIERPSKDGLKSSMKNQF